MIEDLIKAMQYASSLISSIKKEIQSNLFSPWSPQFTFVDSLPHLLLSELYGLFYSCPWLFICPGLGYSKKDIYIYQIMKTVN